MNHLAAILRKKKQAQQLASVMAVTSAANAFMSQVQEDEVNEGLGAGGGGIAATGENGSEHVIPEKFDILNLQDLNGPEFWKAWERAGGDPDEYIKETLPNFSVVGTLLLTITIPLTVSPISFSFDGTSNLDVNMSYVRIYAICLNISTGTSLAMIILSMAVYQQFVNAYSRELRVGFAAKFGYVVTIFETFLVLDIFSLLVAMFIGMACIYEPWTAIASVLIVTFLSAGSLLMYVNITTWNSNVYSKQMVIDIQRKNDEERKKLKNNKRKNMEEMNKHEKLLFCTQSLQKVLTQFADTLEEVIQEEKLPSDGNLTAADRHRMEDDVRAKEKDRIYWNSRNN